MAVTPEEVGMRSSLNCDALEQFIDDRLKQYKADYVARYTFEEMIMVSGVSRARFFALLDQFENFLQDRYESRGWTINGRRAYYDEYDFNLPICWDFSC